MVNAKHRRYYSLKAEVASVYIFLTATTGYFHKTLKGLHLLMLVFDKQQIMKSFKMLLRLQTADTLIFCGQDPEIWQDVSQAPPDLT